MAGIAIPQGGIAATRRDLGSLVPHPADIGRIAGAHIGIAAPRMSAPRLHLAGGGIANPENISQNIFQPMQMQGVPNADVNFITSPQLGIGKGPPQAPSSQPKQEPSPLSEIAQGTSAANGLTNLGGSADSGLGSLWNGSTMSAGDAASYNAENGLTAGSADFASAGDTIGGLGDWLSSLWAAAPEAAAVATLAKKGGAIPKRADGGSVNETFHPSGLLNSAGPGRTDTINTNVPTGAYVVPADVVSGLGEGNTLAGSAVIDRMFGTSPHGVVAPQIKGGRGVKIPSPPSSEPRAAVDAGPSTVNTQFINGAGAYAKGGNADKAPVVVAGGEHVVPPEAIIRKFGSLRRGHATMDHWVVLQRQKIAKEMLSLANPVGSRVKK